MSDALVDALRDRAPLPPMSVEEAVVITLGLEFFQTNRVSQATFDMALEQFGPQGLVELTTLMGFYAMLAFNANAVDLGLPRKISSRRCRCSRGHGPVVCHAGPWHWRNSFLMVNGQPSRIHGVAPGSMAHWRTSRSHIQRT